jgi:hypothetical protein
LPLSSGQSRAAFPDDRIEALRQVEDHVLQAGASHGCLDPLKIDGPFRDTKSDVPGDARIGEENRPGHMSAVSPP